MEALEPFIEKELEKFEIKKEDLQSFVKTFDGLVINGVDDKIGYKAVRDARISIKKKRVEITTVGKIVRGRANAFAKAVIARENEFVEILEPREAELQAMEDAIDEERDRIRIAEEEAEDRRIQVMSDQLSLVGHAEDYITLKGMSEEQFRTTLDEATTAFVKRAQEEQAERDALAEKNRLEEVQRKEQAESNEKERARLQKIQEEQDRKEMELKAERKKIDDEKREIEETKRREQERIQRDAEMEEAKKEAAEKAIAEKEEKDRLAKEAEEEKLNEGPDSERFASIHSKIQTIMVMPYWDSFKTKAGKKIALQVRENLQMAVTLCETKIKKI